jgi:hypothetical protein
MRRPRVRISGAMFLVVVVAVDCGLLRFAFSGKPVRAVCLAGVLLPANVLAYGIYRLVTARGSRRPFLLGFVVYGLAAMLALLAYAWAAPTSFMEAAAAVLDPVGRALEAVLPRALLESEWLRDAIGVTFITVLLGLPVLAVAAFGGLVCSLVARVAVPARTADQPAENGSGE